MFAENWTATHECLKSLYCERIPCLAAKLLGLPEIDISISTDGLNAAARWS